MQQLFPLLCLLVLGADTPAEPYDLVIRNGRIVDGTGNPWIHGDVAVRGDRIVAVGRIAAAPAKREIDAKGLVIAPVSSTCTRIQISCCSRTATRRARFGKA